MMNLDKKCVTVKVLMNKTICGFSVLDSFQQRGKAVRLIVQWKPDLVNRHQGRSTRFGKYSCLSHSVLEQSQDVRLGSISPEGICSSTRVRLSRIQLACDLTTFGLLIKANV
jgi:hypothetical protein